jgi:peptidoglycan hydrolase-like protein with peptidoglycan-binding domain
MTHRGPFAVSKFICVCAALLAFAAPAQAAVKIEKGDHGVRVERVQRALGIAVDGVYGRVTWRAVRRFQRRHGLTVDGVVGPATFEALGLSSAREAKAVTGVRVLQAIAQCESGGNPKAISANGHYRGKYQFSRATWRALGGKGDPAKASEAEQDRRARSLYRREGLTPWPSCARRVRA